jgi:hypothetical protein
MSVWRSEVTIAVGTAAFPDPNLFVSAGTAPHVNVRFRASRAAPLASYDIVTGIHWASVLGVKQFRAFAECHGPTGLLTTLTEASPGTGDPYRAGGTLAISKDFAAGTVTFDTPLGSYVHSLAAVGDLNDDAVKPEQLQQTTHEAAPDTALVHVVRYTNFWGSQNGARYRGAPLSAAQPGSWVVPAWSVISLLGADPHAQNHANDELVQGPKTGISDDGVRLRDWNGGDTVSLLDRDLDALVIPEHGLLFAALVKRDDPGTLLLKRSGDNGRTFETFTIQSEPATYKTSPNLGWDGTRLIALWHDGLDVVRSVSLDFGNSWSATADVLPSITPAAPDNLRPTLLYLPAHGLSYLFFRRAGNLRVQRWSILGVENIDGVGASIQIATGAPDDRFDVGLHTDGTLRVRFNGATTSQFRSEDWGVTWTADFENSGAVQKHGRRTVDFRYGLTYHLWWDPVLGNKAAASSDSGLTFFADPPSVIDPGVVDSFLALALTQMAEQGADIEVLTGGPVVVVYYNGVTDAIEALRSDNFCFSWS